MAQEYDITIFASSTSKPWMQVNPTAWDSSERINRSFKAKVEKSESDLFCWGKKIDRKLGNSYGNEVN